MSTMAETLVKNPYCSKCGEEARPQAQFCFACGGAVVFPETPAEEEVVSSEWFKGDIVVDADQSDASVEVEESVVEEPISGSLKAIPMPVVKADEEKPVDESPEIETKVRVKSKEKSELKDTKSKKGSKTKKSKLRSAADIRKKPKPSRMKRVEVVWAEKETSPNWLFISLAFVMILSAAFIVYAAIALK